MTARGPIGLTLLTGFLGAGKTTLLNRLLRDPSVTNTAVVVNEFGTVPIDHLLVETAGEEVIELAGGCLCCTARGALIDTLAELAGRRVAGGAPLERVVVETTGLADPVPVLESLIVHPVLASAYRLDGVVAAVDALAGLAALAGHAEARRQVAVADRIALTKTDLGSADLPALRAALAALNPDAPILLAANGEADARALLTSAAGERRARFLPADAGPAHAGAIRALSFTRDAPIPLHALAAFLDRLQALHGSRILRLKALVRTVENERRPLVVHGVRGTLHRPERLPAWPAGSAPASRFVVIGEELDEAGVGDLFAAFFNEPRPDAADWTALSANPLAVPGYTF